MKLPKLKDAEVSGKRVFLRADLDVPLSEDRRRKTDDGKQKTEDRKIEDDTRLKAALPTIEYLLKHNAKVIIAGHLGRPDIMNYELRIMNNEFSLLPIAKWFAKHSIIHNSSFMIHDSKLGEFDGWEITSKLFLLENLRFYKGEETNDSEFAKKLSSLADIYVNDAFAVTHRNHASIAGVPKYLPHFAGLRLQKEVETLSAVLKNPKRPLVVIIGGAKIETKLPLVEKMEKAADYVLVGGKIAREKDSLLKINNGKVNRAKLIIADLNKDKTDITDKSLKEFLEIIKNAGMVVWNGPVGKTNEKLKIKNEKLVDTERGTRILAKGIAKSSAFTIVGGGDTVDFLKRIGLLDKFSFVSTGGGAMLSFLSQEKMPGLTALTTSNN